jgi:hypothetical protein
VAATTSATKLNGATFVDACAKLGDAASKLTAVAMHSGTEAALKKLDLIDFLPDSEGKPSLASFQGRRVVVDDSLPTRAGTTDGTVYTTYYENGRQALWVSLLSHGCFCGLVWLGHDLRGRLLLRLRG